MISITQEAYDAIVLAFTSNEPECGGILGAAPGGPITHFYFDTTGASTPLSYTPNCEAINPLLLQKWAPAGVRMVGIIHSHSNAGNFPSCGDLHYAVQILRAASLTELLLPIVTLAPFQIWPYRVRWTGNQPSVTAETLHIL